MVKLFYENSGRCIKFVGRWVETIITKLLCDYGTYLKIFSISIYFSGRW